MGKLVISKPAAAVYVTVTLLIIIAVGLLAGLVGRPRAPSCESVTTTTSSPTTTSPATTTPTSTPIGPWDNIRLPPYLVPLHYVVDLVPDLEPDTNGKNWFTGTSEVFMEVNQSTSYIYIHSNKLNYSVVEPRDQNRKELATLDWWLHDGYQYLIVSLAREVVAGTNISLYTEFSGELSDDLRGFYRSRYTNAAGKTVTIAITQMQSTDARKAFPCFDEPALKATFDIFLSHKDSMYALSNMPNITMFNDVHGWKKTEFERTPIISTYLLAFIVCDFEFVEHADKSTTQTRIYARPQQIAQGNANYTSEITPRILEYFVDYFNVSYPLPKLDQIAVPDFVGGMENWGLVIYRETMLLYNPAINSASDKQSVASVVAHELAHQWFGNLVTMSWWDELWLNEGFASYVEYLGTNYVEPTWRMNDQFVTRNLQEALAVDGLANSRPIVAQNVSTPSDINALFDAISYRKGSCIVRMINEFLGDEAFKLGLTNYMIANAYGTVNHKELFEYWAQAHDEVGTTSLPVAGESLKEIMDTWVLQMGYPTVRMERQSDGNNMVRVTQQRFLLDMEADKTEPPSPYNYQWIVPLWYKSTRNPIFERKTAGPLC